MSQLFSSDPDYALESVECVEVQASLIARKGYSAIGRCYSHSPESSLKRAEAQQLIAAGLTVFTRFHNGYDMPTDFSQSAGRHDGQQALRLAYGVISQPEGSAIYISVDCGVSAYGYKRYIRPYLRAVKTVFAQARSRYDLGVYGCALVCERARADGIAAYSWLRRTDEADDILDGVQHNILQGVPLRIAGTEYSGAVINGALGDFGGFRQLVPNT